MNHYIPQNKDIIVRIIWSLDLSKPFLFGEKNEIFNKDICLKAEMARTVCNRMCFSAFTVGSDYCNHADLIKHMDGQ